MVIRRLLLLLKPFDFSSIRQADLLSSITNPQMLRHLENRQKVHREAVKFCQNILQKKPIDWKPVLRKDISEPIRDVDLVITVGGDGTLLQASHFLDDSVPVLGVNSDPTKVEEVEEFKNEFDANRSTGYLCAATVSNFEQVLDNILSELSVPVKLSRISIYVNSQPLTACALNDVLIAHPCPATLSRFSFRIISDDGQSCSPLVHSRSSGLRVSTSAGSTAAMHSAGGSSMPILSRDLQYMVREPILQGSDSSLMHGFIAPNQSIQTSWFCKKGEIFIDGSHIRHSIQHGDTVHLSSKAPILKVFLGE